MAKLLLVLGVLAGCIDEPPPSDHLYGNYEVTRTLGFYSMHRTDIEFSPDVALALSSNGVVVSTDAIRDAFVLQHEGDVARFELEETGWAMPGVDVAYAVVGYELAETEPGRVTGRAGASLHKVTGEITVLLGFDLVGERLAPE